MDGNNIISNDVQMQFAGAGMENATAGGEVPSKQPEEKKFDGKKLWMALAIVFLVLAIGGVSFGVVAMLNDNQKAEELSLQVESLEERNDDLLEQLAGQMEEMDTGPIQITPVVMNTVDYIYVGEWGIKIRKPENWRDMIKEYVFYNDYPQANDVLEIKENSEVPTAHALIVNEGETACEDLTVQYDVCFAVSTDTYIVTGLPSADTGGVSSEFREFVLNSANYLTI